MDPTPREQFMLELVNRMRVNPAAELDLILNEHNPDVDFALEYFNVSLPLLRQQWSTLVAAAPLAWHEGLYRAARSHSQLMLQYDQQSHQLPGEADLGSRFSAAGYSNWSRIGENVFAFADSVFYGHAGFAIDWGGGNGGIQNPPGHRQNLMSADFRDIGIGIVEGSGAKVGPLLITQDFGRRSGSAAPWLLGVAFADDDRDGFYDIGEGLGNVHVEARGPAGVFQTLTMTAGGYQLQAPSGTYTVTFSGGLLANPVSRTVTIGNANVKLDLNATDTAALVHFQTEAAAVDEDGGAATVRVIRGGNTAGQVSVEYRVQAGSATPGQDYEPVTGRLVFEDGETSRTLVVPILPDEKTEGDETFVVQLANPSPGAVLGIPGQSTVTIRDSAPPPTLTIDDAQVLEGRAGTTTRLVFTVRLSDPISQPVTAGFQTRDGTAAVSQDYTPAAGQVTIPPGQTTATIRIEIRGDGRYEENETILVDLVESSEAEIIRGQATGHILNDDLPPVVSVADAAIREGNEGTTLLTFQFTLSAVSGTAVVIQHATADGTATAARDYIASAGQTRFEPGETRKAVVVAVQGDTAHERHETFFVQLLEATGATIGDGEGRGRINNDDRRPSIHIAGVSAREGENAFAEFVVQLTGLTEVEASVTFATAARTALAWADFTPFRGVLTFLPGETTKTVQAAITNDAKIEGTEVFYLILSRPASVTLATTFAAAVILDDDAPAARSALRGAADRFWERYKT